MGPPSSRLPGPRPVDTLRPPQRTGASTSGTSCPTGPSCLSPFRSTTPSPSPLSFSSIYSSTNLPFLSCTNRHVGRCSPAQPPPLPFSVSVLVYHPVSLPSLSASLSSFLSVLLVEINLPLPTLSSASSSAWIPVLPVFVCLTPPSFPSSPFLPPVSPPSSSLPLSLSALPTIACFPLLALRESSSFSTSPSPSLSLLYLLLLASSTSSSPPLCLLLISLPFLSQSLPLLPTRVIADRAVIPHLDFPATGNLHQVALQHDPWVLSLAFSPSGTHLCTSSVDGDARIWSVLPDGTIDTASRPLALNLPQSSFSRLPAWSPDGALLAAADGQATVVAYSALANGDVVMSDRPNATITTSVGGPRAAGRVPDDIITSMAWSSGSEKGHRLVVGTSGGSVKVFGIQSVDDMRCKFHRFWPRLNWTLSWEEVEAFQIPRQLMSFPEAPMPDCGGVMMP